MKKKVYVIKKVNISEGLIETDTEVYDSKEDRDSAWHRLVHDHNEMVRECFCDEDKSFDYILDTEDEYHYEFDDNHLEFWCVDDPEMHTDFYDKGEDTIAINDKVFVVLIDSYDGEGSSIIDMELFSTLEAAKAHLKMCVDDFKNDVTNWNDTDIYTIEDTDEGFTWYETGYYDQNHYCVDIYERTIYDKSIKLGGK